MNRGFTGFCSKNIPFHPNNIPYIYQMFPYFIIKRFILSGTNFISVYIQLNFSFLILQNSKGGLPHLSDAHNSSSQTNLTKFGFIFFPIITFFYGGGKMANLKYLCGIGINLSFSKLLKFLPSDNFLF